MLTMLLSAAGTLEAGSQITLPELEVTMNMEAIWAAITMVIGNFLTDVLTPVIQFITTNDLALIFLGISIIGIAIRYVKRVTYAFGRGR